MTDGFEPLINGSIADIGRFRSHMFSHFRTETDSENLRIGVPFFQLLSGMILQVERFHTFLQMSSFYQWYSSVPHEFMAISWLHVVHWNIIDKRGNFLSAPWLHVSTEPRTHPDRSRPRLQKWMGLWWFMMALWYKNGCTSNKFPMIWVRKKCYNNLSATTLESW
jgi:hypothetical protein